MADHFSLVNMLTETKNRRVAEERTGGASFKHSMRYRKSEGELSEIYKEFQHRFSPDVLKALVGSDILHRIFLSICLKNPAAA